MDYRVEFTDVAAAAAKASWSLAAVEERARQVIAGALGEGFEHLWRNIYFHIFEMPGSDEPLFVIYPCSDDAIEIDTTSTVESLGEHDAGGMLPLGEVLLPRRDSER